MSNEQMRLKYLESLPADKRKIAELPLSDKLEIALRMFREGKIHYNAGMEFFRIVHNLEDHFTK